MIGYFSSSSERALCLDVFKTAAGSFRYLIRTMMSSGFCNCCSMYCFSFLINFLYCSLAYLCLAVVPNIAPKLSASSLKLWIYDVYTGQLKRPHQQPRPLWSPLPVRPHRTRPWPLWLAFYLLVMSGSWVVFVSMLSPILIPVAGGGVSVSGFIVVYLFFLNHFKLTLLSSFHEGHKPTRW